jgi:hydrogenase maturation protease
VPEPRRGHTLPAPGRLLVIGIGNPYRSDDRAGLVVAERLAAILPTGVPVLALDGDAPELLAAWEGASYTIVIDSLASGRPAGTVERLDAGAAPLAARFATDSTHGLGLAQAIELARTLGTLPARVVVYGIEGGSFAPGTTLTPGVAAALDRVVEQVRTEVETAHTHAADW